MTAPWSDGAYSVTVLAEWIRRVVAIGVDVPMGSRRTGARGGIGRWTVAVRSVGSIAGRPPFKDRPVRRERRSARGARAPCSGRYVRRRTRCRGRPFLCFRIDEAAGWAAGDTHRDPRRGPERAD